MSEIARIPLRAWNAVRIVVANPGLWLTVMPVVLVVFSPFSETRYGLFTVIAGYAILAFAVITALQRRRAASEEARSVPTSE